MERAQLGSVVQRASRENSLSDGRHAREARVQAFPGWQDFKKKEKIILNK
jgi:hypothetical protein